MRRIGRTARWRHGSRASTWNQHVSVLSSFYQWAVAEGHASAVPFSYGQARGSSTGRPAR